MSPLHRVACTAARTPSRLPVDVRRRAAALRRGIAVDTEAVAALDAADVDGGTVTEALLCWLDGTWRLLDRYPLLRHRSVVAANPTDTDRQHAPVVERLERLIRRGQDAGEFDRTISPAWLVSATIALGHAAGADFAAGRMTATQAAVALRHSILRLYGVCEPVVTDDSCR